MQYQQPPTYDFEEAYRLIKKLDIKELIILTWLIEDEQERYETYELLNLHFQIEKHYNKQMSSRW